MERKKMKKGAVSLLLLVFLVILSGCLSFSAGEPANSESLSRLENRLSLLATQNVRQDELISHLATQVGATPFSTSNPGPTPTPYQPIIGGIRIEDGACCVGGVAGETTEISVFFVARNVEGKSVKDMRIMHGGMQFTETQMETADWEAYTSIRVLTIPVATNWTTYYVCVQFRDSESNLSPVMCADIAVEGHPSSQTPSPQG